MSTAQRGFNLRNPTERLQFERGNHELGIRVAPAAAPLELLHVVLDCGNYFAVYLSPFVPVGTLLYPAVITWECWIGGPRMLDARRLFQRKTVLIDATDARGGLLWSMAGPAFSQVILRGRLDETIGGANQTGQLRVVADAMVGMSGNVTALRVIVGSVVG